MFFALLTDGQTVVCSVGTLAQAQRWLDGTDLAAATPMRPMVLVDLDGRSACILPALPVNDLVFPPTGWDKV